ncbi:hypothetical protein IEO21_10820 [Rhodonia placenta]|uniref:Uncharacterized protein n=1 Tax=Rhodonia placenta TaxID=104341 RepID=A0A8H7TX63_9APHY|nr:hypothetical protein IEO21_10820 [Postia placenta]
MLGAACVMRRTRSGKATVYDKRPLATTETTSLGAHPFTLQQTDLTSNLRTPPAYEKHAPQRLEGSASEPPTSSGAGEQVGSTYASTVPYTAMSGRLNESVLRAYHHNII